MFNPHFLTTYPQSHTSQPRNLPHSTSATDGKKHPRIKSALSDVQPTHPHNLPHVMSTYIHTSSQLTHISQPRNLPTLWPLMHTHDFSGVFINLIMISYVVSPLITRITGRQTDRQTELPWHIPRLAYHCVVIKCIGYKLHIIW